VKACLTPHAEASTKIPACITGLGHIQQQTDESEVTVCFPIIVEHKEQATRVKKPKLSKPERADADQRHGFMHGVGSDTREAAGEAWGI
jgi:hypothetical protein